MNARLLHLARLIGMLSLSFSLAPAPTPRPALALPVQAIQAQVSPAPPAWSSNLPVSPVDTPTYEDEVMMLVNQARWENGGLPPLKRVDLLDNSSETHSGNMATRDFFAHCDPDTLTLPWDRMEAAGYNWNSAAENIAAGYSTPAAVMTAWMNSTGHRANILSTSYRELGIGYVYQSGDQANIRQDQNGDCTPDSFNHGPYFSYWTQNFGRRNPIFPAIINREDFDTATTQVNLYLYGAGTMTEMRFRNEADPWTDWEPFQSERAWTLSTGNGLKTVQTEVRDSSGMVYPASDTIWLDEPGGPSPTPTPSPTWTHTPTPTPLPPSTETPTPNSSPSPTATSTAGPSPTPTSTWTPGPPPTASPTPTGNPTATPGSTSTAGPSPVPSHTATPNSWSALLYLPIVRR